MEHFREILLDIDRINALTGSPRLVLPVLGMLDNSNDTISIAVLGQFKSGKSTLINSILGEDILPVGAVPVTAIETRIGYSSQRSCTIQFLNGDYVEIDVNDIAHYITEKHNPGNIKGASHAIIRHPALEPFRNVCFWDTPGLGSIFRHNTETALQSLPAAGSALVCISAERPMSDQDLLLIKDAADYCPEIALVITKTDLVSDSDLEEIRKHINNVPEINGSRQFRIMDFSARKEMPKFRAELIDKFISPLNLNYRARLGEIIRHKIISGARQSIEYTRLAIHSAAEHENNKGTVAEILDQIRKNRHYREHEMLLMLTRYKDEVRNKLEEIIMPYKTKVTQKVLELFHSEYAGWGGFLPGVSRRFEVWIAENLRAEIEKINRDCHKEVAAILNEPAVYFEYTANQFRQQLSGRIAETFGVHLPETSWKILNVGIDQPAISVYRVFESHLDLILFFLPVRPFKRITGIHFRKQIPVEVEKNLYRYISDLTGRIMSVLDRHHRHALAFMSHIHSETDQILMCDRSKLPELKEALQRLQEIKCGSG